MRYLIQLTGKEKPRVCFLPTATGDLPASVDFFYQSMGRLPCEPRLQRLFINSSTVKSFEDELLSADAIFVGGNGGEVARLLEAAFASLRSGGRLVTNVGTLEMLSSTYAVLKRLGRGVEVLLVNISRGVEQLEALRFEAVNPTFLLRVQKPAPDWVV